MRSSNCHRISCVLTLTYLASGLHPASDSEFGETGQLREGFSFMFITHLRDTREWEEAR